MSNFDKCIPKILESEGGLVDHVNDPGGITNYGISFRFIKGLELDKADVNRDGVVNADDIIGMTKEDAIKFYRTYFWNRWYDELTEPGLALHLFDMAVNAGASRAHKLLQGILNVKQDGLIGQNTVREANKAINIVELYAYARKEYYKKISDNNPDLKVFLKGWLNRVDQCSL